ncbi:GlxA family transcriptional regulator [Mesorhizobium waimense]|uniref:GlxA family transcriptional regulator n=1 Tax=Mesorhizobium waimense TaxID=1300307 RepID=A0A3A5K0N5_9HYPH|nr:GlxA family transcriptional regulator [Mesorhizobium waimense]RJT24185.1 GlxA family transcriptional regulator [Mesorhizobium waimense]
MNVHSNARFVSSGVLAVEAACQELPNVAILIVPGFSNLALGAFIEPLSVANSLIGREVFRWRVMSLNGKSVVSASGIVVEPAGNLADLNRDQTYDHFVVFAGQAIDRRVLPELNLALRSVARRNIRITAIGTATWLLAHAGLLKDTRCTIHWSQMAAFSETFKDTNMCNALFVRGEKFSTCAGELAAFDFALDLMSRHISADVCKDVCRYATAVTRRSGHDRQTTPAGLAVAGVSTKLAAAINLMEDNIEFPLDLAKLSKLCKISTRQLERLFMEHVGSSPAKHYRRIRLEHARRLVEGTSLSLTEIAIACGFMSASHFSKCFREMYGAAPSHCR